MEIGRNEPCPCKSGKKYKKCHGNMKDQPLNPDLPIGAAINGQMNKAKIKQCIHPESENCSVKIIKAHTIQNNRILTSISRNGELYMVKPAPSATRFKYKFKLIGRGAATTFTGFCGHHDNQLFEPIEEKEYIGDEQQHFLFAYRTFSFEYHKKMEAQNAHRMIGDTKPSLYKDGHYRTRSDSYEQGVNDNLRHKKIFDDALIQGDYGIVETISIEFECSARLAASSGFFLEYDIDGKQVNNLHSEDHMRLLMLNIFPVDNNRTVVLFSWLKEDANFYAGLREQILALDPERKIRLLNNMIPAYCENVVYNPDFIDNWSPNEKSQFLDVFALTGKSPVEPAKRNLLRKTSYNLLRD